METILGIILFLVSLGGYSITPEKADITWEEFVYEYQLKHPQKTEGEMKLTQSRIGYERFWNKKNRNNISVDLLQAHWEPKDSSSLNLTYGIAWDQEATYGGNIRLQLSNNTGLSWGAGLFSPYHTQSPNITLRINQPLYFSPENRISFSASFAREEVILQEVSFQNTKQTIYLEGLNIYYRWIIGTKRYKAMKELCKIETYHHELVQSLHVLGQITQTEVWNSQKLLLDTQIMVTQSYNELVDLLFLIKLSGAFQNVTMHELLKVTPTIPRALPVGESSGLFHEKRSPDLQLQLYESQINQLIIKRSENRARNFPVLSLTVGYTPMPLSAFIPSTFIESWSNTRPLSWVEPFHVSIGFHFPTSKPDTLSQRANIENEIYYLQNLRHQRVEYFKNILDQLGERYLHTRNLYNQSLLHLDLIRKQIETLESVVQIGLEDPLILQQSLSTQIYKELELDELATELWRLEQEVLILLAIKIN